MNQIGDIIKYKDTNLLVLEGDERHCDQCFFNHDDVCLAPISNSFICTSKFRKDEKSIIFKQFNFLLGK